MGSGKSTLGRSLAKSWQCDFTDLEHYIEASTQMSISRIFELHGESGFRKKERLALIEILRSPIPKVLSLGGGTPCFLNNMNEINNLSRSVYLKLSPKELTRRLHRSHNPRPLLAGKSISELEEYIQKELCHREQYYGLAKHIIESDSIRTEDLITFLPRL